MAADKDCNRTKECCCGAATGFFCYGDGLTKYVNGTCNGEDENDPDSLYECTNKKCASNISSTLWRRKGLHAQSGGENPGPLIATSNNIGQKNN